MTRQEFKDFGKQNPGIRGNELLEWSLYIDNGGLIAPIQFLDVEHNYPDASAKPIQIDVAGG